MAASTGNWSHSTPGRSTSLMQLARTYGKIWRPWLLPELATDVACAAAEAAGGRAMCSTCDDAFWCVQNGWKNLVLCELPPDISTAERIAEICQLADIIVAVDHFYHAELLSRAAGRTQQQISVAILIGLTEESSGVRPGYDAQRLAQAASRLPGIRVSGLLAEMESLPQSAQRIEYNDIRDSLNVLSHTCDLLRRIEIPCLFVSVSFEHHPELILSHPAVSELRCTVQPWPDESVDFAAIDNMGTAADADLESIHAPAPSQLDSTTIGPSCSFEAAVISRPCLQLAVLQTGMRNWCRELNGESISWSRLSVSDCQITSVSGAVIKSIGLDTTVLKLSGPALDLTIGERVTVAIRVGDVTKNS